MNLLDIDKASEEQRMISEEVNDTVVDHLMSGIITIVGKKGRHYLGVRFLIKELYGFNYFE